MIGDRPLPLPETPAKRIKRAVCHETPSFGAAILHASCIDMFSAKMRSSTRRTTRSLASLPNFLGIFQIFLSTQTEQNLGHFTPRPPRHSTLLWGLLVAKRADHPSFHVIGVMAVKCPLTGVVSDQVGDHGFTVAEKDGVLP